MAPSPTTAMAQSMKDRPNLRNLPGYRLTLQKMLGVAELYYWIQLTFRPIMEEIPEIVIPIFLCSWNFLS